jgi:hypothetical protein
VWNGPIIELNKWVEFDKRLISELNTLDHNGLVLIRNFALTTSDVDDEMNHIGDVDRFDVVLNTGTDRDCNSSMWNADGHDHNHRIDPSGKKPDEIIYAFVAETNSSGYLLHIKDNPEYMNLTDSLTVGDGILIYDASKLKRVSKNEHWFLTDPCDALLLVFKLSN